MVVPVGVVPVVVPFPVVFATNAPVAILFAVFAATPTLVDTLETAEVTVAVSTPAFVAPVLTEAIEAVELTPAAVPAVTPLEIAVLGLTPALIAP